MGCWCETDGITQLPINAGDKVRVFIIVSQGDYCFHTGGAGGSGTCYSTDRWSPLGPAIQGEYDDYGGVENIVKNDNAKMIEAHIAASWVPLTVEHDWDKIPDKLKLEDYVHFIERDRGKIKSDFRNEERHLGIMFVLEDVYQAMISFNPIEAHHDWEARTYEYMPLQQGLRLDFKQWYEKQLERAKMLAKHKNDDEAIERLYEIMADMDHGHLFGGYKNDGVKVFKKPLQALANELIPFEHKKVQKVVDRAMEMHLFQISMTTARKQWIPQTGKGGQHNELPIYRVINAATEKIIKNREDEYKRENLGDDEDICDENGYKSWQLEHNKETQLKRMEADGKENSP